MKIGKPSDDRVIVTIKTSRRDEKSGKIAYETFESIDVFDAGPQQVHKIVNDALVGAASKTK